MLRISERITAFLFVAQHFAKKAFLLGDTFLGERERRDKL